LTEAQSQNPQVLYKKAKSANNIAKTLHETDVTDRLKFGSEAGSEHDKIDNKQPS
jgi:hypothetical protein